MSHAYTKLDGNSYGASLRQERQHLQAVLIGHLGEVRPVTVNKSAACNRLLDVAFLGAVKKVLWPVVCGIVVPMANNRSSRSVAVKRLGDQRVDRMSSLPLCLLV